MNAQRTLVVMQTLTDLEKKIEEYEQTIKSLLLKIDTLEKDNKTHQQTVDSLFKMTLCPNCSQYLQSKKDGDTVEGYRCTKAFLHRCPGIAP